MGMTQQVVHLLKSVINGTQNVRLDHDFSDTAHCYVPVEMGAWHVVFWKRSIITRVASVEVAGHPPVDYEGDTPPECWVPPPAEAPHWWALMAGHEHLTHAQLRAALKERVKELALSDRDSDDRKVAYDAVSRAEERCGAYNPWNYLSEAEQNAFEAVLCERSRRAHLRLVVGDKEQSGWRPT